MSFLADLALTAVIAAVTVAAVTAAIHRTFSHDS